MNLTLTSKKPKAVSQTIAVRPFPHSMPPTAAVLPQHKVQPQISAHPVKHSCSESAIPTWFCKAEKQQFEEDQDAGQKAKEPASRLHKIGVEDHHSQPSPLA